MKRFALVLPFTFTLLLLSALWLASTASPAHAAPTVNITVNTLDDENNSDGDCSLREAIAAANTNAVVDSCTQGSGSGDDTIIFGSLNGTIVLSLGDLDISSNLTINGGNVITVSGNNATRVFNVTAGNVTFDSLNIINGNVQTNDCGAGASPRICGGGIMIQNSTVTVMVSNSTLSGNSADNGGGIYNHIGMVTVSNSTLSGNSADNGGGIYNHIGTVTVSNSTLSGNSAGYDGGGIYNASTDSDEKCANNANMTIHNSTLSGNSAYTNGGGIYNFNGVMAVTHTTITGNTVDNRGGGVFSRNNRGTCTRVGHTIIAGNSNSGRGDVATDIRSQPIQRYVSLGHNLIGTAGTNVDFTQEFTQTGDITNTLPLLGALADNGGQTQTVAPMPNSVAIDNGDCTSGPATDQRGVARPDDTCDIGAYEGGTMQCGVSAGNSYTFANQSGVSILVNSEADLECLYVDEIPVSHPNATGVSEGQDLRTGKYWLIGGLQADRTSTATFNVDLTLPYLTASTTTRACKWLDGTGPGFGWNCEDGVMGTSFDLNSSVTRVGVTAFSQWAVGDGVGPTAVTDLQTDITPAVGQGWLVALLVGLLGVLTTAVVKRRRHS